VRRKLVIGALVAAGAVLVPTGSAPTAATMALGCSDVGPAAPACPVVNTAVAAVCYGSVPVDVGTVGPLTVHLDGVPTVQCPQI
jgi:hypothetical protein